MPPKHQPATRKVLQNSIPKRTILALECICLKCLTTTKRATILSNLATGSLFRCDNTPQTDGRVFYFEMFRQE